jgi:hypothetical protein
MSPKVETTEKEGMGARSLARSTSKVKGNDGALGWGLDRLTNFNYSHIPAQTK